MPKGYPKNEYPELYGDESGDGDAPPLITNTEPSSGPKPPPKYKTTKSSGSSMRTSAATPKIDESVAQLMTTIGISLVMAGGRNQRLLFDGQLLIARADETGKAMDELARRNPRVKAALEKMFEVGAYGSLMAVGMQIAIPIAANHGLMPRMAASFFMPDGMELPPEPETDPITVVNEGWASATDEEA